MKRIFMLLLAVCVLISGNHLIDAFAQSTDETAFQLLDISPARVDLNAVADGVTACITGEGFVPGMTVLIGNIPAEYTLLSETELSLQLPVLPLGKYDITIRNGVEERTLKQAVTYYLPGLQALLEAVGNVHSGTSVQLPVRVSDAASVTEVLLQMKLDLTYFENITFVLDQANAQGQASCTTDETGLVTVRVTSEEPLMLSQALGCLQADVKSVSQLTAATITLDAAQFNGVDAEMRLGCTLQITPCYAISGRVTYGETGRPMAGVLLTLSTGQTAVSDADGYYSFTKVHTNAVTITASFDGGINGSITAQDASLVLQALKNNSNGLTAQQLLAADMDADGQITQNDALCILQMDVGIADQSPAWLFNIPALNLTEDAADTNITATLLGDVSGNWMPAETLE